MAIKILIGGSPCTYWSIAQTNNRETKAEGMGWELFKNYLIAKEKFKPDFFLYENNKSASQAIKDQIAEEFGVGVDPDVRFTYINSALVSAQNRQRFYVTNFGDIEQPEDRGILLKDILVTGRGRYDKAPCLDANYYKGGNLTRLECQSGQRLMACEPIKVGEIGKGGQGNRIYSVDGKSVSQTATSGGIGSNTGLYAIPVNVTADGKAQCIRATCYKDTLRNLVANDYDKRTCVAEPVEELCPFVEDKIDEIVEKYGYLPEVFNPYNRAELTDKSPTLTTCCGSQTSSATVMSIEPLNITANGKSQTIKAQYQQTSPANILGYTSTYGASGVAEPIGYATPVEWDENGKPIKAISCADGKTYTVYEVKDGQITIKDKHYPIKLPDGYYIIRKLTVAECARLQTMPDDYCKAVSDSQAYKALGNGWTAEVIIHLLNHALKDVPRDEEIVVLSMYDGIATGRYCLDKMGFTNVTYHAYEIDKYPIMVAMDNYPDIIQHGDAFAVREDDWEPPKTRSEWLDELLGGDL